MTLAELNTRYEHDTRLREFGEVCRYLALANTRKDAALLATAQGAHSRVVDVLRKAAIDPGGLSSGGTAALGDFGLQVGAFISALVSASAFDKLRVGGMVRLPVKSRVIANTILTAGSLTGEMEVKPVSAMAFEGSNAMQLQKVTAITAISEDVAKFGGAGEFIIGQLKKAVALGVDAALFQLLTAGITATVSSGSGFLADLRLLLAAVETSAESRLYLLTTPAIQKSLAAAETSTGALAYPSLNVQGGNVAAVETTVSDGVPSGTMALVAADGVGGESADVAIDQGREATLELSDTPSGTIAGTSLFQLNQRALKCTRWWAAMRLRDNAIGWMEDSDYSTGS